MKITVEFPASEMKEICRLTGEQKKGPAIRKLVEEALMLKRREALAQKFISGQWGVELKGLNRRPTDGIHDRVIFSTTHGSIAVLFEAAPQLRLTGVDRTGARVGLDSRS